MLTKLSANILAVFALTFLLAGCQQSTDLDEPPVILFGQDVCDECNMIISDPRFAAAYVTTGGEVRRFDDIGGMLKHAQKTDEVVHVYWVHDYESEAWLNASDAQFVFNQALSTPMGWGIAAFSGESAASEYAAAFGGTLFTFTSLQEQVEMNMIDPTQLGESDHESEMDHAGNGD